MIQISELSIIGYKITENNVFRRMDNKFEKLKKNQNLLKKQMQKNF